MGRSRSSDCAVPLLGMAAEGSGAAGRAGRTGIHWAVAAAFVVADMAGGGVVTMPLALLKAGGPMGALVMTVVALCFCYTAHLLGQNWLIMKRRWPVYHDHCRKPYPEMAFRSLGHGARFLTAGTLHVMLFGVSVVYLLLSAKILNGFASVWLDVNMGECRMMVLLTVLLFPVTLLKSPQDFWLAVVLAMLTTVIAVSLIVIGILQDSTQCQPAAVHNEFSPVDFVTSLGIFMFAFGGHGVFPTILHDMRRPAEFTKSSLLGFAGVCALYLPVTILGFTVYGDSLTDSVLSSIQSPDIRQAANLFIAAHCILTLTIVINPLNQELEHKAGVLGVVTFVALSVPSFGPLLNLIGGTAVALTSAIMPCVFNMCLVAKDDDLRKDDNISVDLIMRKSSRLKLGLNLFIIGLACVFGTVTTISALGELYGSEMSGPCYSATYRASRADTAHCCGHFLNISSGLQCESYHS